ncbi:hypothetical protein GPNCGGLF_LOCUS4019 [Methylorubrum aminovorans]
MALLENDFVACVAHEGLSRVGLPLDAVLDLGPGQVHSNSHESRLRARDRVEGLDLPRTVRIVDLPQGEAVREVEGQGRREPPVAEFNEFRLRGVPGPHGLRPVRVKVLVENELAVRVPSALEKDSHGAVQLVLAIKGLARDRFGEAYLEGTLNLGERRRTLLQQGPQLNACGGREHVIVGEDNGADLAELCDLVDVSDEIGGSGNVHVHWGRGNAHAPGLVGGNGRQAVHCGGTQFDDKLEASVRGD